MQFHQTIKALRESLLADIAEYRALYSPSKADIDVHINPNPNPSSNATVVALNTSVSSQPSFLV